MIRSAHSISSLVIAGFVAFAFSVAPVGLDNDFSLETKSAFAKGKGSGKSSSRGSSSRGGGSRGGASSSSGPGPDFVKGSSNGQGQSNGPGQSNGQGVNSQSSSENHGSLASALGNLNAAHASPTALEHVSLNENAAENSIVGLLAAYAQDVVDAGEPTTTEDELAALEAQRIALGDISNKSYFDESLDDGNGASAVDEEVVDAVNDLLADYSETLLD